VHRKRFETLILLLPVEVVKEVIQFFWSMWQDHERVFNVEPAGGLAAHPAECHFFKSSVKKL
jgi:hypothetical protein